MVDYVRKLEANTIMSFKINDKQLLKKCNQIWKKVEKLSKIQFHREPVYGDSDKYIKTKRKIYAGSTVNIFRAKEWQKEKYHAIVDQ